MDAEIGRLALIFEGQIKDVMSKIDSLDKGLKEMSSSVETSNKKVGDSWLETAKGFVVGQFSVDAIKDVFGKIVSISADNVRAFDEQAVATALLRQSLGGVGVALEEYANKAQFAARFTDEQIIAGEARLTMFTKEEKELQRLMPLILDFATRNKMDVASAADVVGKSIYGTTNMLGRYGIEITGARGSSERFESAVQSLTKAVGGQAAAIGKVGMGPLLQMNKGIGELQEKLGEATVRGITPFVNIINEKLLPALDDWLDRILRISEKSKLEGLKKDIEEVERLITKAQEKGVGASVGRALLSAGLQMGGYGSMAGMYTEATQDTTFLQERLAKLRKEYEDLEKLIKTKKKVPTSGGPPGMDGAGAFELEYSDDTGSPAYAEAMWNIAQSQKIVDAEKATREMGEQNTKALEDNAKKKKKVFDDLDKRQKESADLTKKISKEQIEEYQAMAEQVAAVGDVLGEAIAGGFEKGFDNIEGFFLDTLTAFMDFLKQLLVGVIIENTLNKFGVAGAPGIALAAVEATIITAVFEGMKTGMRKMEDGGPVSGRSHAQGGTLMELEAGEYVARKSAVDYYGREVLEALNRQLIPREALRGFGAQASYVSSFAATGGVVSEAARQRWTNVNFVDPSLMERYLNTVEGQRAFVNVIYANSRTIRRILG